MSKNRRALAALFVGLAMPMGMIAVGATANAATQARRPAVEVCGTGAALVRPGSMILTCADNGELATHLHWSTWAQAQATASGTVAWRTGTAAPGSRGHWQSTRAQFTLMNPVSEPGGRILFTSLRLHVTGSTPPGFMRNLTFDEAPATVPAQRQSLPAGQQPATGLARPAPSAASGTLSYADIEGFWIDAGGPSSVAETAAAITGAESSYLPGVIQPGVDYCGTGEDRAGWGLWQITCGNSVPAFGTDFQVLDPWNNAEAAVSKYEGAGGFSPWSTYTSGAYMAFLQGNVSPSTNLTDPGEYVQVNSTPPGTPTSPAADPGSTYGPALPGVSVDNSPAAGVDSSFNVYTFWKGTNGGLYENNRTGSGSWSGAHEIPGMGPLGSQPTVAVTSAGNQYVFWEGTNGNLWEGYYLDSSWHGPNEVTDTAGDKTGPMASPPTAGVDSSGNVYIFWKNSTDGGLEETSGLGYQPGSFNAQHEIPGMAPLGSAPTVAVSGGGNQYVFWQNANGYLEEAYNLTSTWHGPSPVTDTANDKMGPMATAPGAGIDSSGNVYVFWQNSTDSGLEETSGLGYQPGSFNAQHEIPGMAPLGSAPGVAVAGDGNQLVFWKGANANANLFEANWNGTWNGPTNLQSGPLG